VSNFSQFFPSSIPAEQILTISTPGNKRNRQIFYGPSVESWTVPQGTTEVEVHVWGGGGGGNGTFCTGSGGGGGYARTRYKVSSSDILCVTVGGNGGTSSVTIPTQSPISPMSATGGSNSPSLDPACCVCCSLPSPSGDTGGCGCISGGAGGSGSVSLGPLHPRSYCFVASGGTGGCGSYCCFLAGSTHPFPNATGFAAASKGGGAAGSPRGNGIDSAVVCHAFTLTTVPNQNMSGGGGSGIGGYGLCHGGGSKSSAYDSPGSATSCLLGPVSVAGMGARVSYTTCVAGPSPAGCVALVNHFKLADCRDDTWFSVEDIGGVGGLSFGLKSIAQSMSQNGGTGAGGGGSTLLQILSPNPSVWCAGSCGNSFPAGNGGLLGGGGGHTVRCSSVDGFIQSNGGYGGCAGGSGGNTPGTPGVVIIYW
jgi:hypothetical protein